MRAAAAARQQKGWNGVAGARVARVRFSLQFL